LRNTHLFGSYLGNYRVGEAPIGTSQCAGVAGRVQEILKAPLKTLSEEPFKVSKEEFGGFGPDWILGCAFMSQFCNIFDIGHKRVGFAQSRIVSRSKERPRGAYLSDEHDMKHGKIIDIFNGEDDGDILPLQGEPRSRIVSRSEERPRGTYLSDEHDMKHVYIQRMCTPFMLPCIRFYLLCNYIYIYIYIHIHIYIYMCMYTYTRIHIHMQRARVEQWAEAPCNTHVE
uniref:Peptidase A1 domain-containing protein n=1 Tax=Angiostrongylus cantonensis TaxID=6313 RepID=A0A158PAV6_ANGCA